jgi:hypothetical protein
MVAGSCYRCQMLPMPERLMREGVVVVRGGAVETRL